MQKFENSNTWFPERKWRATTGGVTDLEFLEFDEQAQRLVGYDQDYLQLTDGQFRGRFVSCYLGDVSLHFERANQALSQSIAASTNTYSIGVVLSGAAPFRVDGIDIDQLSLFVVPPHTSFHLFSPKDGAILAVVLEKFVLEEAIRDMPRIRDWVLGLGQQVGCLHAPMIADRLRHDAKNALFASCNDSEYGTDPASHGQALTNSFLTCLFLEFSAQHSLDLAGHSKGFRRFAAIKSKLEASLPQNASPEEISNGLGISKRSLQYAFSSEVSLGVAGYLRHSRLRSVRRGLLDPTRRNISIGDIAAQYGYWSWSHFSQQYSKHFGERPSDTRLRLT
ncbi:MAG: helix-turn-helix domain-containing protein [Sulfitobacter sp.]